MNQNALTLITPFEDKNKENLKSVFKERKEELNAAIRNMGTVHYARGVIIDGEEIDHKMVPPQLVLSSNFDGDIDTHVKDLVSNLGNLLDLIYNHTTGYTPDDKEGFLLKCRIKEAAFYKGAPNRSVKDIEMEKELHQEIFNLVKSSKWEGQSAKEIHQSIREKVLSQTKFEWAKEKIKTPSINWPGLVIFGIILLILSPIIILWAVFIQVFYEQFSKPLGINPNQLPDELLTELQKNEDFIFQNQFSQIIEMKPGLPRLITVNALYMFARILIKLLFVNGKLMGIPTIHFARWIQVNNKKRMLFFSNFDGSWTQYLGDFIDKSGWGLTGIFGNTKGFPRSLFLIFKGAYNQRQFLAWSRRWQIPTQYWYVADPSQSIKNINNNTLLRNDLNRELSEKDAKIFLTRI
jgi:hypothetical protein